MRVSKKSRETFSVRACGCSISSTMATLMSMILASTLTLGRGGLAGRTATLLSSGCGDPATSHTEPHPPSPHTGIHVYTCMCIPCMYMCMYTHKQHDNMPAIFYMAVTSHTKLYTYYMHNIISLQPKSQLFYVGIKNF